MNTGVTDDLPTVLPTDEPDVIEVPDESDSMRSTLDEAFTQHEDAEPKPDSDLDSELAATDNKDILNDITADDPVPDDPSADPPADDGHAPDPVESAEKPPLGWKADAREVWDKVPDTVKKQINDRERDIAATMENTAEARRVAKTFSDVLSPFKAPLENMGYNDPFKAVHDIMGAATRMSSGTPTQRAHAAANVIQSFGIDINELDNALVGSGSAPSANTDMEALLDKRMEPVNRLMSEITKAREVQVQNTSDTAVRDVESFMRDKEFGSDVRMDMADLMDMAAGRNQSLSLQGAYDKACMMQPDVSKVIQERQRVSLAKAAAEDTKSKRLAASSVTGSPSGGGVGKPSDTLAASLNEAWDYHINSR